SRFTSATDERETASNFGSELYAPSRNMFGTGDAKTLPDKDALAGEILKETSARRRWVTLCWLLTWWVLSFCLSYVGRMKRLDVPQAWRKKLAINVLIRFACGATGFVIVMTGSL
ncbi:hypothetical protein C8F04DRAFT_914447, partial [Mycena alexandri]